ncbi:MAG: sigma-70 family RNA polymerase sigma factor [Gemmatimonadetes bacterium]|nr:sigma-70 family RNA polymerase sigma factor [Gemmatimonadota bacterium]
MRADTDIETGLIARMARGEEAALAALYDRLGGLAYSLACAVLGDPGDAEEAVADAFLQIWSSAAAFDPARSSVAGWVSMITRTRALDRLRARRRRAATVERAAAADPAGTALPVAAAADPAADVESSAMRERVTTALAGLPPAQRRVIELAYFGGLSHSEIAAELSEPLGTIKTRIRAGMEKLRATLLAYSRVE